MTAALDVTGVRFGMLTAMHRVRNNPSGTTRWMFRCDCGTIKELTLNNVKAGLTKSCGCLHLEHRYQCKHGHARQSKATTEYKAWYGLIQRCHNASNKDYIAYGGRGITVCDSWASFENFLRDMGRKPSKEYSIDRINTNGNYEPSNCRWATPEQQSRNKRPRGTAEYAKRHQRQIANPGV
jgi:hypothetical protein